MCGAVSVPVTRSTSVPPKFTGAVSLCTSLENALEAPLSSGSPPPFGLAAENHDRAGSEVFHLVDAQLVNLGTIKSRWNKRADLLGLGGDPIFLLRLCRRQWIWLGCGEQGQ